MRRYLPALALAALFAISGCARQEKPAPPPSVGKMMKQQSAEFFAAADSGDARKLRGLAKANPSLLEMRSTGGDSALIRAADGGRVEAVQELLKLGSDTDARDDRGNTALHRALLGVSTRDDPKRFETAKAIVRALLNAGMTPHQRSPHCGTAMGALASAVNLELHGAGGQAELPAGYYDLADYLLSAGAKMNEDGESPLLHAFADWGYMPGLKFALSKGAVVDAKTIALARQMGHPEAAALLEKNPR